MLSIVKKDINSMLPAAISYLKQEGVKKESRNGPVIEYPTPVCSTYLFPSRRVLFNSIRDANPFFHFMESMWMLAGRNDVAWLSRFNSNIKNYSDDGKTFHAAYGQRIRGSNHGEDQLNSVIKLLKDNPDSRRAVVQIWDPIIDFKIDESGRDIPCNTTIYFLVRGKSLEMTVCCRSNDAIWGAYGANVVHFSYIMEYVACSLGLRMGVYNQISNSLHVYTENPLWVKLNQSYDQEIFYTKNYLPSFYKVSVLPCAPLMFSKINWDSDLVKFMKDTLSVVAIDNSMLLSYKEPFFKQVAIPMFNAWVERKYQNNMCACYEWIDKIVAGDWYMACHQWVKRREDKK